MKTIHFAAGLFLATLPALMPTAASAQSSPPEIVVSGKYLRDWQKGSKLEATGLKQLERARQDLVQSSAAVVNAQDKQSSSQARSENASAEFRSLTASTPSFDDAGEALRWARQVERAADNWQKFNERGGEGANALEKAMKAKSKAEKAVTKAQETADRGRALMADAERRSTPASGN